MASVNLTWQQLEELKDLVNLISNSRSAGADEGQLKNSVVEGEWNEDGAKITLNLE